MPSREHRGGGYPEIVSREGREAIGEFHRVFFGELGALDLAAADAALGRIGRDGVTMDLRGEEYSNRMQAEIQYLLGWRPRPGEHATWIGFESGTNLPATPEGARAVTEVQRAMMSALARSVPKPARLDRLEAIVAFAEKHGMPIVPSEEFSRVVRAASMKFEYAGDPIGYREFAERVGSPLDARSSQFAIEGGIIRRFDAVSGISDGELESVEVLCRYANEHKIPLELGKNAVFEGHLLRDLALKLKGRNYDAAQRVFDFCERHRIPVNAISRNTSLSESLNQIMESAAHHARNALDLASVEAAVAFCRKNNIRPNLPDEMLRRWRTQIPELVARNKNRFGNA